MAVRRESVRLSLEDDFTSGMARAAAATALLKRELNDLSGSAVKSRKDLDTTQKDIDRLGTSSKKSGPEIDKLSGRLRILTDVGLTLGPALAPIGASLVPALSAAALGLTVTAGAAGTMLLAVNGLGDGLKALNAYQLDKSAENLQALRIEMEKLGPDGAHFVRFLDQLEPQLRDLQLTARAGMLPGWEDGISSLLTQLPGLRDLVGDIALTLGNLGRDAGSSLAGDDFAAFFDYLSTDAAPTLDQFARTVGNFANGFANLLVGLAPATRDFSGGLLELSQRFEDWSASLDGNDKFEDFLTYVRESGPQVIDLLGTTATTLASIAEAVAPVGSVVLPALTGMVKVIGALAGSPLGSFLFTSAAGFAAYSRGATIATAASARFTASQTTGFRGAKVALGIGLVVYAIKEMIDAYKEAERFSDRLNDSLDDGTFNMAKSRKELADFKDDLDTDSVGEFFKNMFDPDVIADFTDAAFGLESESDAMAASLKRAGESAGNVKALMGLLAPTLGMTADELQTVTNATQNFSGALSELNGWLDQRQALRDYRQSIRDVAAGFADGFGKKDIENIDAVGRSIAKAADQFKSPTRRSNFLANSRAALVELKTKSGPEARAEIQLLIGKLDELGITRPKPKVEADNKPAKKSIDDAQDWLDQFGASRAEAQARVDSRQAQSALSSIFGELTALDGKTATTFVRTVHTTEIRPGTSIVEEGGTGSKPPTRLSAGVPLPTLPGAGSGFVPASRISVPERSTIPIRRSYGGSDHTTIVKPQSLVGLKIQGAVRVNGLEGYIDGRIVDQIEADKEFSRDHKGGTYA